MTPGETIDSQIDALETKIELLMKHLGLEFEFHQPWSDAPTGIKEAKKGGRMSKRGKSKMNIKLTKVQLEMIKHFKETKSITTACTLATTLAAMVEEVENGN